MSRNAAGTSIRALVQLWAHWLHQALEGDFDCSCPEWPTNYFPDTTKFTIYNWLLKLFRFPLQVYLILQPCTYASLLFSNHLHFTDTLVTKNPLLIQNPSRWFRWVHLRYLTYRCRRLKVSDPRRQLAEQNRSAAITQTERTCGVFTYNNTVPLFYCLLQLASCWILFTQIIARPNNLR